jgi:hypothetical protein
MDKPYCGLLVERETGKPPPGVPRIMFEQPDLPPPTRLWHIQPRPLEWRPLFEQPITLPAS